jgi:AraC-like DNA-binding protein
MRSEASALLPVLRSRNQADLLTLLLLHPDQEYTLTELAGQLGIPLSTLHREAQRLVDASILLVRAVGRARLLRANTANRLIEPLTQLLLVTFGPHVVIAEEFGDVPGVDLALIFGSWAARYQGELGPPPNDVDVLLVGDVRFPVNVTIASPRRWSDDNDPLVREIKASAIIPVRGLTDDETHEGS